MCCPFRVIFPLPEDARILDSANLTLHLKLQLVPSFLPNIPTENRAQVPISTGLAGVCELVKEELLPSSYNPLNKSLLKLYIGELCWVQK